MSKADFNFVPNPNDYKYELRAAKLPLFTTITAPAEGDRGRNHVGAILVYRFGQWVYE